MRQIAKPIFRVAALLLLVFLAPSLLVNAWLLLPSAREKVLEAAREASGLPGLSIRGMHAIPFAGIRLSSVSMGVEGGAFQASSPSMTLTPRLPDLLRGRFVLHSVSLVKPDLTVRLPPPIQALQQSLTGPGTAMTASPVPSQSPRMASLPPPSSATGSRELAQAVVDDLSGISVRRGRFLLADSSGKTVLLLENVNGIPGAGITASSVLVGNHFLFTDTKGDLEFREGHHLVLQNLAARFGGGSVTGWIDFNDPLSPKPFYHAHLVLSAAKLCDLFPSPPGTGSTEGTVSGDLEMEGTPGEGSSMNGRGRLSCSSAVILPVDFLQQVGRILGIEELQVLKISEGRCLFRIEQGRPVIEDLFLRSENLCLAASGAIVNPAGELSLDARLLFNGKLVRRLGGLLGKQLLPAPEAGYSQILFHVSGSPEKPRTDLLERLTGIRIGGDLGGFLQGLFGAPRPPKPTP